MIVWRIARHNSIDGSTAAGRWNERGVKVLYTSSNPSLCSWEYFAHQVGADRWPTDLSLISIEIPDDPDIVVKTAITKLPSGWNKLPYKMAVRKTAKELLIDKNLLGIKLPSVIIPEDWNFVLNPNYPNYTNLVKKIEVIPFDYDARFKAFFP